MSPSRKTVSSIRTLLVFGTLAITATHLLIRLVVPPAGPKAELYDLLLRQKMGNYPDFVAYGWLPLDIATSAVLIGLFLASLYLLKYRTATFVGTVKYGTLMAIAMGAAMFGLQGSLRSGWYTGLTFGIIGALVVLANVIVLLVGSLAYMGIDWAVRSAYEAYIEWWLKPWATRTFGPIVRWFKAEDIPEQGD
jgi:hypothetical protein